MSSDKTIVECLEAEASPELNPMENPDADAKDPESSDEKDLAEAAPATLSDGSEPDPDTRRRLNHLDNLRRRQLSRIAAELTKHDNAVGRIEDAQAAIAKAQQDERNARVALSVHIENRDTALARKAEHEDKLREINDKIRECSLTPAQRKARDTRREADRRRAEAAAAELAARQAYEAELVPFEQTYFRIPGRRRSEPDTWGTIAPHNRHIKVKRKDLAQLEADHREAVEYFAKEARDALADEYEAELRTNGRPTYFASKIERGQYLAAWGSDSLRGRAYRARQNERGLSESDPARLGKPMPGVYAEPG
jgi:hypothetical protein